MLLLLIELSLERSLSLGVDTAEAATGVGAIDAVVVAMV
jgi:hypothetical protein